jgi:hypothetical protein
MFNAEVLGLLNASTAAISNRHSDHRITNDDNSLKLTEIHDNATVNLV